MRKIKKWAETHPAQGRKKDKPKPQKVSGNDTVKTPLSLLDWLKRGGDWERARAKTVHAIFRVGG